MQTRAITGFFFVLVMIAALHLGDKVYAGFFLLLSLFSLYEFYGIIRSQTSQPNRFLGLLLGFFLFFTVILNKLYDIPNSAMLLGIPLLSILFINELYRKSTQPFSNIGFTLLGILFVIFPFVCFFLLGFLFGTFHYAIPLAFLILLWANDTGAYLAGRYFGKRKLFERHSPKKTWEGAIGGLLTSLLSAYGIAQFFTDLALWQWMSTSAIIVIFGTYGDLVESMLKRSYSIKDSGNILPGHGGLLDRFDGLLLSAPLVYAFLVWSLR